MAVYSVEKDGRYKEGVRHGNVDKSRFVSANDVPDAAKTALKGTRPGALVDELGDKFDPETDIDDGNTDETLTIDPAAKEQRAAEAKAAEKAKADRKKAAKEADAEDEESEEDDEEEIVDPSNVPVQQDEPGMGFKRVNGKTVSVFSGKPHETVKAVGGYLVPLTVEEYNTKTDAEILKKLRALKKI